MNDRAVLAHLLCSLDSLVDVSPALNKVFYSPGNFEPFFDDVFNMELVMHSISVTGTFTLSKVRLLEPTIVESCDRNLGRKGNISSGCRFLWLYNARISMKAILLDIKPSREKIPTVRMPSYYFNYII